MGYTITEKILLKHTKLNSIHPGEFIDAKVDICLGNDITAPLAIEEFEKLGLKKVFDRKKVVLVPDHFTPAKDMKSANHCKMLANFAKIYDIKNYFEISNEFHASLQEVRKYHNQILLDLFEDEEHDVFFAVNSHFAA